MQYKFVNNFLVTCDPDGSIPLNSKILLELSNGAQAPDKLKRLIEYSPDLLQELGRAKNCIMVGLPDSRQAQQLVKELDDLIIKILHGDL